MYSKLRALTLLAIFSLGLVACSSVPAAPGGTQPTGQVATAPANPTVASTDMPAAPTQEPAPTAGQPTTEPTTVSAQAAVAINNFAFDPQTLTVKVGTTVTWTNQQGVTHTATSDAAEWDSGRLSQGQSFSFTFTKAGTLPYHCAIHPSMTGTIEVTN